MDLSKVEKLNDKNYYNWKFRMEILLNEKQAWEVININCNASHLDKLGARERKRLKQLDNHAKNLIVQHVDDSQLEFIRNKDTSFLMWARLEELYQNKGITGQLFLKKKLLNMKLKECESISNFISSFEEVINQLQAAGVSVTEAEKICNLLMALPKSFEIVSTIIEQTPNITWDSVRNILKNEEEKRRHSQSGDDSNSNTSGTALFSNRKSDFDSSSRNNKSKIQCYKCNRFGHLKRDCKIKSQNKSDENDDSCCKWCKKTNHKSTDCFFRPDKLVAKAAESRSNYKGPTTNAFVGLALPISDEDGSLSKAWIMDSGASEHMTYKRSHFATYSAAEGYVKIGDGNLLEVHGVGDVNVITKVSGEIVENVLKNVLHVPNLKLNLFSIGQAMNKGFKLEGKNYVMQLTKNGCICAEAKYVNKIYILDMEVNIKNNEPDKIALPISKVLSINVWHELLAHQNYQHCKSVLKSFNIEYIDDRNFFCDACMLGKQARIPFENSLNRVSDPCDIICADLCGPMEVESIGGSKYFLLLKDYYSKFRTVYFIKNKSEVVNKLQIFFAAVQNQTNRRVKYFRTDNGSEFINKDLDIMLKKLGICHQTTVRYCPEQAGKIERENRTVVEAARTLLESKNLKKELWAEAVNTAVDVLNRSSPSYVKDKTPYELWFGSKPDLSELRIFGSEVFVQIPTQLRKKFDPKSKKGIFVGYEVNKKGYRVYFPDEGYIEASRDVVFRPSESKISPRVDSEEIEQENQDKTNSDHEKATESEGSSENVKERRNCRPPAKLDDYELNFFGNNEDSVISTHSDDPTTLKEVKSSPDCKKWLKAIDEELKSLNKANTWELEPLPEGKHAISNKWVFKRKYDNDGNVERFKARLVVRGCSQRNGIDYHETYAPVVCMSSLRSILAIAASKDLHIVQFDIKTAFLNGVLKEDIYMLQPDGFEDGTNKVCRLRKSLYGLKQAPRCWNKRFQEFLMSYNLIPQNDECVFVSSEKETLFLAIFVDDGLIAGKNLQDIHLLLKSIKNEFDVSSIHFDEFNFLGINIKKTEFGISAHQQGYTKRIISRFQLEDACPVSTPLDVHYSLNKNDYEHEVKNTKAPYREAIGSLMYLSTNTRPDISFAVNLLSRYQENPLEIHWTAVKRLIRYLKGTTNKGLFWPKSEDLKIEIYSDSDYGGDKETRKSTSGCFILLNGGVIAWKSQKQKTVSLSTAEAELNSASEAVKEFLFLKILLEGLLKVEIKNVALLIDNQAALKILVDGSSVSQRSKHIHIRQMFIEENFDNKLIIPEYVNTKLQLADILTKPLPRDRFNFLKELLNIVFV